MIKQGGDLTCSTMLVEAGKRGGKSAWYSGQLRSVSPTSL